MMAEQCRDNERAVSTKHPKKCLWTIFIIFFASVLCLLLCRFFFHESADEKLAAIEAARAIPDSKNAAVYYRRFLSEPNNVLALDDLYSYTPSASRERWHDSEFPELAAQFETHRQFIETLLEISEKQEARFQIYPDPLNDWNMMLTVMRQVTFVLSWAAANDLAEGRIDEALRKYRCQIRLACHLKQHPVSFYWLVGTAIEAVGLNNIRVSAMHDDITQEQLNSLNAIMAIPRSYPDPDPEMVEKLDRLIGIKQRSTLPPIARLRDWWQDMRSHETNIEKQHMIHTRLLSGRQGTEIVIALRRYKDKIGHWPESLNDIKPFVAENILIDPANNGPFVYKLTDDGFLLYSKGENNIDDDGQYKNDADDRAIWPKQIPQTNEKIAGQEQSVGERKEIE